MSTAWDDVVAVAVQGTDRRQPDRQAWLADLGEPAATIGGDPASAVLDAAALATVARRAGALTLAVARRDDPPPTDPRPVIPTAALELASSYPDTLTYLFARADELRLRLPAGKVPWLLDLARGPIEADVARRLAGPLGRWLAARNRDWSPLYQQTADAAAVTDDRPWREGTPAVRLAWLRQVRRLQPELSHAYVREALAPRGEPAPIKEQVIRLLADLPDPADDDLLEASLDARAAGVRDAAAHALRGRPDSAFAQRMRTRFRQWIHVEHDPLQFVVQLPTTLDAASKRDGMEISRHSGEGSARRCLRHLLTAVDLATWQSIADPADVIAAGLSSPLDTALLDGWAGRAVIEADAEWAATLLGLRHDALRPHLGGLARVVPPAVRDAVSRALLPQLLGPRGPIPFAGSWFEQVPFPVPDDVCAELIEHLPLLCGTYLGRTFAVDIVRRIGREQPPGWADALAATAHLLTPQATAAVHDAASRHAIRQRLNRLLTHVTSADPDRAADSLGPVETDRPDTHLQQPDPDLGTLVNPPSTPPFREETT